VIEKSTSSLPVEAIKILVVIPTYNNRPTLRGIAEAALKTGYPLLVVNDGSTDGGPDTLDGLNIARLDFKENRGKGAAIREAAVWAEDHEYTHIITLDGDGQHDPAEVEQFAEAIMACPHSIIVGNRQFRKEDVPFKSRFGRHFSNFWIKTSSGVSIPDSQCGYRAYPVQALRRIHCRAHYYNFEVEILVRGVWAGLELLPVDISVVYSDDTQSASHFKPFLDNARISFTYAGLVIRNFSPWPHKTLFGVKRDEKLKTFFLNPWRTLKMLVIEKTSSREIALAVFLGIFLGTLPLIAMHSIIIVFFATRLRLNRLIALNVSHFCAPPIVPALAIEAGYFLRHGHFLTEFTMQTLGHEALQRLTDYLLGSVVIAPVLGSIAALLVLGISSIVRATTSRLKQIKGAKIRG